MADVEQATIDNAVSKVKLDFLGMDVEDTFCKSLQAARLYLELVGKDVPWWRKLLRYAIGKAIEILARGCPDAEN